MGYTDDGNLPVVTDEMLNEWRQAAHPYTIMILEAGPDFPAGGVDPDSETWRIIWAHGKRNLALRRAGILAAVCPIADGSGVTGIGIFDAPLEEVDRIMADDPGVRAGLFTYHLHPTQSVLATSAS